MKPRRAFSLLELMIAMGLLGGLLAVAWSLLGTYKNAEERGWKLAHRVQTMRSIRTWLENDAVHMVPVSADPSTTPVHGIKGKFQGNATGFTVTIAPSVNPIGFFEHLMSPSQENAESLLSTSMGTEDELAALDEPPSLWPEDSIQIEYRIQSMGSVSPSSEGMLPSEAQYEQFLLIRKENDSGRRRSSTRMGTQGLGWNGNSMQVGGDSSPSERLLSGSDLYRQTESNDEAASRPKQEQKLQGLCNVQFHYFDGWSWSDEWNSDQRQGLPVAIALGFDFPPSSDVSTPMNPKSMESTEEGFNGVIDESLNRTMDEALAGEPTLEVNQGTTRASSRVLPMKYWSSYILGDRRCSYLLPMLCLLQRVWIHRC